MKKITQTAFIFLIVFSNVFAQQEKGIVGVNNWLHNWTEFQPNAEDYGEPTEILTGQITEDTKLLKKHVYLLLGNVFVTDNAVLTIEPGTVIIGDFETKGSLTIAKGSTIIADGTETDPIVFTSNRSRKKPGDWGGVIILGDAPTNRFGNGSVASYFPELTSDAYSMTNFGGDNTYSHSGIMKYVRIEYAGTRISRDLHFSGLLVAGVGKTTIFENLMVSYSGGTAFEVWGGEVTLDKAVAYKSANIDFKFNYGAQSKIHNSLAVRSPYASSNIGSKSMQVESYTKKEEVDFNKSGTSIVATNLTLVNQSEDLNGDIQKGLIKEALHIGPNTSIVMSRSVLSGFSPAVIFDNEIQINQQNLEKIEFSEMYFNNCNGNIFVENNSNNDDLENWYGNPSFFNVYSKGLDSETFIDMFSTKRPDFRLRINQIMATNDIGD